MLSRHLCAELLSPNAMPLAKQTVFTATTISLIGDLPLEAGVRAGKASISFIALDPAAEESTAKQF